MVIVREQTSQWCRIINKQNENLHWNSQCDEEGIANHWGNDFHSLMLCAAT